MISCSGWKSCRKVPARTSSDQEREIIRSCMTTLQCQQAGCCWQRWQLSVMGGHGPKMTQKTYTDWERKTNGKGKTSLGIFVIIVVAFCFFVVRHLPKLFFSQEELVSCTDKRTGYQKKKKCDLGEENLIPNFKKPHFSWNETVSSHFESKVEKSRIQMTKLSW